jgi:hypothetical protein
MAAFNPNDWRGSRSWFARCDKIDRSRARERNQETLLRWVMVVAFCLCFASLGPPHLVPVAFAGLLFVAALASIGMALVRGDRPTAPHLTLWDEASFSLALGMGLGLWLGLIGS